MICICLIGFVTHNYRVLGAHPRIVNGIAGGLGPNAAQVNVVGDFNNWSCLRHPLRRRGGIWQFIRPGVGMCYQYEIRTQDTGEWLRKSDPYGRGFEQRPATASVIVDHHVPYPWRDEAWML